MIFSRNLSIDEADKFFIKFKNHNWNDIMKARKAYLSLFDKMKGTCNN